MTMHRDIVSDENSQNSPETRMHKKKTAVYNYAEGKGKELCRKLSLIILKVYFSYRIVVSSLNKKNTA